MRVAIHLLAASALVIPPVLAQVPNGTSGPTDPIAAACPRAAAFARREKERQVALVLKAQALPPTHPEVRDELMAMESQEQSARVAYFTNTADTAKHDTLLAIDAKDLSALKKIVSQYGFPTVAMVGRDGMHSAWILTQHADADVEFQKQALAALVVRPEGEVRRDEMAMLEDRIRVHEGLPQRYGGNFDLKTLRPTPIEDPDHVDERRAQVHLMPMADYQCVMEVVYHRKP